MKKNKQLNYKKLNQDFKFGTNWDISEGQSVDNIVIEVPKVKHKNGCSGKSETFSTKHFIIVSCMCQFDKQVIDDEEENRN